MSGLVITFGLLLDTDVYDLISQTNVSVLLLLSSEPSSSSPLFTKRSNVKIDIATELRRQRNRSSSASEVPVDNQGPVSDPGLESGEPNLGSSYPQALRQSLKVKYQKQSLSIVLFVIVALIVEEIPVDSLRIQSYGESLHIPPQLLALSELEFNKAFLLLSYIPGTDLVQVKITTEEIRGWKDLSMVAFEAAVWERLGKDYCSPTDRRLVCLPDFEFYLVD
ncbi:unnamed protein product [Brassica napus]|uniref:(rape) hypothetical protein n=1 Tax=Brassica napus TaxID=3708 RepID=A0A816Y2D7_BRANA|nr:unnamed protein product [Brassica napus]